ncbi:hypothetical protein Tsubulata_000340, partial [Turnera subulata]
MAYLLRELPSVSTLLSAYASISTLAMLFRTIFNEMIPRPIRNFISAKFSDIFSSFCSDFTFIIEDRWHAVDNETFRAAEVYLPTRVGHSTKCLLLGNDDTDNFTGPPKPGIPVDGKVVDEFQGMRLVWALRQEEPNKYYHRHKRHFVLRCKKNDREKVMRSYLPHVCKTAESILDQRETLNIYTYDHEDSMWEPTLFKHPATFETLALEPELKQFIIDDLDLFVKRKEYFQSVGRAWKRGFNIYDLQLQGVPNDAALRRILTSTTNRSILLIEDIDCSSKSTHSRNLASPPGAKVDNNDDEEVTLSGLLNFIDGLWSSCGDERIIIFTTNHKEKLDPALLRPGRMDVHVYMGHCTPGGFRKLAATYLRIKDHFLFNCVEDLIQRVQITPAEVAQQLMKGGKPQVVLEDLIEFLKTKENEAVRGEEEKGQQGEVANKKLSTSLRVHSALCIRLHICPAYIIPKPMREFFSAKLSDFFLFSPDFTFIIEDRWQAVDNETYRASEVYLPTRVGPSTRRLLLGNNDTNNITAKPEPGIPVDGQVVDEFQGMRLEWTLCQEESKKYYLNRRKRYFELKCKKHEREDVMRSYLPHVCRAAESIMYRREKLNIYTFDHSDSMWEETMFKHPATFETLALEPELKKFIIDDLDLFVQRKEYFRSVGRAWKRGYLLHGPPGTGKSTLVAAIANYLRFNIFDLQLQGVKNDAALRRILTSTTNRSILLIEDIDCSTKSTHARVPASSQDPNRGHNEKEAKNRSKNERSSDPGVTLSGLLNFIDGLWSSCGDERIIIFTTNHKEKLDPALLRPGRMDVHVYMGHCTPAGFRKLAATYLHIEDHVLFKGVEDLIQKTPITPAEVAQQLMKCGQPQGDQGHEEEFIKQEPLNSITHSLLVTGGLLHILLSGSFTIPNTKMAYLLKELPSMSTLLSAYASISALAMLFRTILNEMIPKPMRDFISAKFSDIFSNFSSDFTFIIEDRWQAVDNETFRAIEVYLPTRVGHSTKRLLLGNDDTNNITAPPKPGIPVDGKVVDDFQGMRLVWTLHQEESKKYYHRNKRHFELQCKKNDREEVMRSYLPHVCKTAESILNQREKLNIYTYDHEDSMWESTVFKHPATFETLALEPELKQFIIDDLDLFVKRKEYFQSVGRAWKRGYLLYGPPGTGKSTLVAAIANYLRFNIYDLQLQGVRNDAALRRILTSTTNRSILLIEDIDCSSKSTHSRNPASPPGAKVDNEDDEEEDMLDNKNFLDPGVTLSGLLNFIDGLWSSCGDERIIIFTTNHREKLDPALLRPGRMDVHVYMGHCTPGGFRKLAATYLRIKDHFLFNCVEDLIQRVQITPAEVAQQLMKGGKPQVVLEDLIEFLNTKEKEVARDEEEKGQQEEVIKQEIVKCEGKDLKEESGKNNKLPSLSTLLSAYASISALLMLVRAILNEIIPKPLREFFSAKLSDFFLFSPDFTFIIEDRWQAIDNETYRAIEVYLPTRVGPSTKRLLLGNNDTNNITAKPEPGIPVDGQVVDEFQGMRLEWTLCQEESRKYHLYRRKRYFELKCKKHQREEVMRSYLPHVCRAAESIMYRREKLNIYTFDHSDSMWEETMFKHPATFETLALEPELKQFIIDDLDLFVQRKEYFRSVGRAWKRGYLLYGPPGTGKSTLLQGVKTDAALRRILTSTTNRSILLIEDIDCSTKSTHARKLASSQDANRGHNEKEVNNRLDNELSSDPGVTSGLLNFIDGLWSSCGDERIIIFTTNHKEKLDPALLRPGRMDVHVYMGHCTPAGFRKLAATYLHIEDHVLFKVVEDLIQKIPITPAEVAQQLMKCGQPQVLLEALIEFLNKRKSETVKDEDDQSQEEEFIKQMAYFLKELPSMSTLLSAYASISALAMLFRTILNEMVPKPLRDFISAKFSDIFSNLSSDFTFVIEDRWQAVENETFRAIEVYLPTRVGHSTKQLLLGNNDSSNITAPPKQGIPVNGEVVDEFQGMRLVWTLHQEEESKYYHRHKRHFVLRSKKKDKDEVMRSYLPHVCKTAESILNQRESLNIYSYDHHYSKWESTVFKHPATFETLALEPELKQFLIDDLDLFVKRKEYFQSVGRAWKRGYLLYGPPGTGKSTLVAAIANYLRFDIYDLQLQGVRNDAALRRILTSTTNRSILLIEDIDCSSKSTHSKNLASPPRAQTDNDDVKEVEDTLDNKISVDPGLVTLSGLLNFIDGLWSSCGDERIIIFTTNHKEKLDPALLRPGRMDVHVYMGHCTPGVFRKLAATYLQIKDHVLFTCVQDLIQRVQITPAEVAQQLMKSGKPQGVLEDLIHFLNTKENETVKGDEKVQQEEVIIKQEIVKCEKEDLKEESRMNNKVVTSSVYLT